MPPATQAATTNLVKFPGLADFPSGSRSVGVSHLPGEHLDEVRRRLDPPSEHRISSAFMSPRCMMMAMEKGRKRSLPKGRPTTENKEHWNLAARR
jgi:hypothetical protein